MSECLYCGDCCKRMSPFDTPDECRYLVQNGTFYHCAINKQKPIECSNHKFNGYRFCPVGVEVLGLTDVQKIAQRIDEGWLK